MTISGLQAYLGTRKLVQKTKQKRTIEPPILLKRRNGDLVKVDQVDEGKATVHILHTKQREWHPLNEFCVVTWQERQGPSM